MRIRKKENIQGSLFNRAVKNPLAQYAGVLSYAIILIMRIPLYKTMRSSGVGMFAPAFEIFFLLTLFTSYSITAALTGIIRYRVKREQYRNAKKVFRTAFFMDFVVSMAAAVLLAALASKIAGILALEPYSRMAVMAAAPVVVFASFIGTFRGYFNGYGLGMLTAHSQYVESISMAAAAVFCSDMLYTYGLKVAALKQNDALAYAYGAMGAMLGVMLSQIITTLHLLIVYVIYSGTLRGKLGMDNSRRMETQYTIQRLILDNSVPLGLVAILSNLFMLIDQRMAGYCMNKLEMEPQRTAIWGDYYGKCAVLIGVGAAFAVLNVYSMPGRICSVYEREEYRVMRERIGRAVRRICIAAFPISIYLAVLAKALLDALFGGDNSEAAVWVREGAVLIVLYGFCFLFGQLMYRMHMMRELLAATLISLIIHAASAYLLVQRALLGVNGVLYSLIIFFAVYAVLDFVLVSRSLKYRQEWFGGVLFPAAAAGVSGAAVGLTAHFLLEPLGAVPTILIGVLVGLFFYVTFLMILRVIGEAELSRLPLGFFFIMLGRNIGVL